MIKSLSLTNFRKHAELDLKFQEEGQLVLINGKNGVGKTSILEAITFALYGEGRAGRKNLDMLVKRGAELEGMSVEMSFTLGQDLYRIHRRRDGKNSTAVLYVNDSPLVEGPLGVTAEITALLGMDSQGFKLAVVAQQKDLDGLSSVRPAERAQMITRLLRLDVLTKAKDEANATFRKEREIFKELQTLSLLDSPKSDLQQLKTDLQTASLELSNSSQNLQTLKDSYATLEPVNARWVEANVAHQVAVSNYHKIESELKEIQNEYAQLVVPQELPQLNSDINQLSQKIVKVENEIAQAELYQKAVEQSRIISQDIISLEKKMLTKQNELKALPSFSQDLEQNYNNLLTAIKESDATLLKLQKDLTLASQLELDLTLKYKNNQNAEGLCEHCGQNISPQHQANQAKELNDQLAANNEILLKLRSELSLLEADRKQYSNQEAEYTQAINESKITTLTSKNLTEQIKELHLRILTLNKQLTNNPAKLPVGTLEELYEEKTNLATLASKLQRNLDYNQKREQVLSHKLKLQVNQISLESKLSLAKEELTAKLPNPQLQEEYQNLKTISEKIEQENLILTHWTVEIAKIQEQIASQEVALSKSLIREQARNQHQLNAINNANAATLLLDVSEKLAQEIRPLLEANVSNLLTLMSEGRFTQVQLSEEYEVTVLDDEKFRPLSELSGGEIDLVALALRLALADVVSSRHGSGGAGFLILDECFASQDQERRSTILSALRNLKTSYHQIFLVSHVENMEDYVDQVISISLNADRSETEIICS